MNAGLKAALSLSVMSTGAAFLLFLISSQARLMKARGPDGEWEVCVSVCVEGGIPT